MQLIVLAPFSVVIFSFLLFFKGDIHHRYKYCWRRSQSSKDQDEKSNQVCCQRSLSSWLCIPYLHGTLCVTECMSKNLECLKGSVREHWLFLTGHSINSACDFPFASKCSWNRISIHQGKKEVACIVSRPLVSCLWGCGESVKILQN